MDFLKVSLIANIIAIIVAATTAGILAWQNAASRNLALAGGTLVAAMVLFVIQLRFELQRSVSYDHISTELTVDRSRPSIRQWMYVDPRWRILAEVGASDWLAANNPAAFAHDREKLTLDMVIFSLVSFLATEEYDWQLKKVTYKGKASGTLTTLEPVSKSEECSSFNESDLKSLLSRAGNLFANAPLTGFSGRLCLPPKSTIEISARSLVIQNPICRLSFDIEPSGGIFGMQPGTGGQVPQLPGGGSQFETRPIGLNVETTYFALRAQHRQLGKYREWCSRVISGAREWFQN